jgi:hypothetical protein
VPVFQKIKKILNLILVIKKETWGKVQQARRADNLTAVC